MSLISNTTNVVGSTTVVSLYNVDKYNSKISFDLTKDSQLIYFLNFVSELLKYQDCDSYNIFVNLLKKNSINWSHGEQSFEDKLNWQS